MLLTAVALLAFAGNSILCRLALRDGAIDPCTFTAWRLLAGAVVLAPLLRRRSTHAPTRWQPVAGLALFVYAIAFSLAYVSLDAGAGALLLFGCVQLTMLGFGLARGERPTPLGALGIALAMAGVVALVLPGASAPPPLGAALMALSGIAWGAYSLLGRGVQAPTLATARNFALAAPLGLLALLVSRDTFSTTEGVLLATASGAITSGAGYVIWYAALPQLSATNAAVVQLGVPVIAAVAGVVLLGEVWTARTALAAALTLGGIALAVTARARRR